MLKRRVLERQLLLKYEHKDTKNLGGYYIVSISWVVKWKIFLFNDTEEDTFLKNYFFDSFNPPKEICNSELLDENTNK